MEKKKTKRRGPYGKKKIEDDALMRIPDKVMKEYEEEKWLGPTTSQSSSETEHSFASDTTMTTETLHQIDQEPELESEICAASASYTQLEEVSHTFSDDDFLNLFGEHDDATVSEFTLTSDADMSFQVPEDLDMSFIQDDELDSGDLSSAENLNIFNDEDSQPLFEGARVTTGAFMLLLALFTSKHRISGDGIQQLLQIVSLILPSTHNFSVSLQAFRDFFKHLKNPLKKHYYCPSCSGYIENPMETTCSHLICKKEFREKVPYFLEIPVIEQIRSKFQQSGFYEQLQGRFHQPADDKYKDIYDGTLYKNHFVNGGPLSCPENISFVFNTDGASVFKSNNTSIWPVLMTINELPYKVRMMRENMILAGLWFGKQKPSMSTFLKPFKQTMLEFYKGVEIISADRGAFVCRGFLLAGTADLPARSLICNSVQYNGSFGCWKCLQKGKTAKVGKGHTHVFPFCHDDPKGPPRTKENVVQDAQEIVQLKQTKNIQNLHGVKGPSWLLLFPDFSVVDGIAIDYMHGVLLGVQKLLLRLWFDKSFVGKPFNFHNSSSKLDELLECIHPTSDVSRLPRSIKDLKYWKASEYRSFLLYYGAPTLQSIIGPDYFQHYLKLVQALFLLLKFASTTNEIDHAEMLLYSFCRQFANLYDECYMTLNIHQLVHLSDSVRTLGPLYTHSCFPFEDKNGFLLKTIRGTQNIDSQIITGISFVQKLPELKEKCIFKDTLEDTLCRSIENPNVIKRGQQIGEQVYILGAVKRKQLDDVHFNALTNYLEIVPFTDTFLSFNRLELKQQLIYGIDYSRMIKRDNSTVFFDTGTLKGFCRVHFFCEVERGDDIEIVAFVNQLSCQNYREDTNIRSVQKTNTVTVIPVTSIKSSCILVDLPKINSCYVCMFPNKLECD